VRQRSKSGLGGAHYLWKRKDPSSRPARTVPSSGVVRVERQVRSVLAGDVLLRRVPDGVQRLQMRGTRLPAHLLPFVSGRFLGPFSHRGGCRSGWVSRSGLRQGWKRSYGRGSDESVDGEASGAVEMAPTKAGCGERLVSKVREDSIRSFLFFWHP
jgi:hypothetical protein